MFAHVNNLISNIATTTQSLFYNPQPETKEPSKETLTRTHEIKLKISPWDAVELPGKKLLVSYANQQQEILDYSSDEPKFIDLKFPACKGANLFALSDKEFLYQQVYDGTIDPRKRDRNVYVYKSNFSNVLQAEFLDCIRETMTF